MAAIVRVKRFLDADPLDTFILKCKKRKLDHSSENKQVEVETTVLKFAGTIQTKETETTLGHLKTKHLPVLEELKSDIKKHTVNLTDKLRLQHKEASKNSRYKIVNLHRSNLDSSDKDTEDKFTILDVETDINENSSQAVNKNDTEEEKYVYDLYYTNSDKLWERDIEEYVSIYPLNDSLLIGSARDNGLDESDSDESEDSNAECNWRNEYPDEDDMESINEDDMVEAMKNVDLDDLSSDNEDNIYSVGSDDEYHDAVDDADVNMYGKRYAAFKAKHKHAFVETTSFSNNDLYYGDIDENEYYY
ncbi:uncharacterized protein fs(2)ltoPP43 [Diabrotica undecimpunctata]|uniref:uncharacterized protein fs(2)ltoPP43 n=1 Tax=Diabrotica undecimpunctata TaxID=50387 RepID=UPI003B63A8B9